MSKIKAQFPNETVAQALDEVLRDPISEEKTELGIEIDPLTGKACRFDMRDAKKEIIRHIVLNWGKREREGD